TTETLVVPVQDGFVPHGAAPPEVPAMRGSSAVPGHRARRRRWPVLVALLMVLTVVVGGGAWWWMTAGPGAYTRAPSLTGVATEKAVERARRDGFRVELADPQYSESVAAGKVVSADPGAGDRVRQGATITLVPSKGKERYEVPPLAGQAEDAAREAVEDVNLVVGRVRRDYSDTVPKGTVISSTPGAGERLRRGEPVDLVVSRGVQPVPVPDVVGKSVHEAVAEIEKGELTATTREEFSESVAKGDVISQDPRGGNVVKGTTVRLVVSKGPPLVSMPDVAGMDLERARALLAGLGLQVRVYDLLGGSNEILQQSPAAGEQIPKGSTVTLWSF
ncbi:MAG: PASTA domain-containing protein, partial [Actinomycetota bacterium]|nr:PASTA domain-containing protein [Actinomycetota bacterium]